MKLTQNEIDQMERTLELLVHNAQTCRALFLHHKNEEFRNRLAYESYSLMADSLRERLLELEAEFKKIVFLGGN